MNVTTPEQPGTAAFAENDAGDGSTFDAWVTGTKVVDKAGYPLIVFHGTQAVFEAFDEGMQGTTVFSEDRGFFFTNDPIEASGYATLDFDKKDPMPNVMPVYLAIKNPMVVTLQDFQSPYDNPAIWYDNEGREAVELAEAAGYDGLIVRDERSYMVLDDGTQPTLFVAFRPGQIRSAIGNQLRRRQMSLDPARGSSAGDQHDALAFDKWFAGSKVAEAGKPMMVFHGTGSDFTEFRPSKDGFFGGGIYFSASQVAAEEFAAEQDDGTKVIGAFLALKNPYVFNAPPALEEPSNVTLAKELFSGRTQFDLVTRLNSRHWYNPGDEFRNKLEAMGHDGLIVNLVGEPSEYIAFRPEQVKIVSGNTLNTAPVQAVPAAFDSWFEGSQIVDAGKPLVVYHGMSREFVGTAFGDGESIPGAIFFTDSQVEASWYATGGSGKLEGRGENVIPVYLSIKNPYKIHLKGALDYESGRIPEAVEAAKRKGHDGLIVYGAWNGNEATGEPGEANETQYVAFSPAQIRSAISCKPDAESLAATPEPRKKSRKP